MSKTLTRAERYKRNYSLVRNKYYDPNLAKKAQTWSDERLYKELGIKITPRTKAQPLKPLTSKLTTQGKRELSKYQLGIELGLSPEVANRSRRYKESKIQSTSDYYTTKQKKLTFKNKRKRMDFWSDWSRHTAPFPPELKKLAVKINRETTVGGKQLDDQDKYGYVVVFYMYVENKTIEEIEDLVSPDKHDSTRVEYKTVVKV